MALRHGLWIAALVACFRVEAVAEDARHFAIQVVDSVTRRGVPLVELKTLNHLRFVTDSNGMVAIAEPDLMGETVYFSVRSHGYMFPQDGFGFQGKAFTVEAGRQATIEVKRDNVAERLYRVTGSGIYRDSVLLGKQVPLQYPLLNAQVLGCDSVMAVNYQRRIHWFWGDTTQPHYPLGGNFHITGAISKRPQQGGLSADVGVRFRYFVDDDGGPKPMAKMPGNGPTWISAVTVLNDEDDRQKMYAGYVKVRNQMESYRWGFVVWNDETQQFDQVKSFEQKPSICLEPPTHSFLRQDHGTTYAYFANPLPLTRVEAKPTAFVDPGQYEGFTCLKAGTRPEDKQLDRDDAGRLLYSWKTNTPPLTPQDEAMLLKAGMMDPQDRLVVLQEPETGRVIQVHSGSVYWNDYRQRWVLIAVEWEGTSSTLGEVWFAEADTPTGPWRYARKIVTHEEYTFYNPKHHPFFDQDGGRVIYFEGTYTHMFSRTSDPTPRYDYNQLMYRLDLSDSELNLPVAYYDFKSKNHPPFGANEPGRNLAFFALEHSGVGTVAILWSGLALEVATASEAEETALFHALPANTDAPPVTTTPLLEFTHTHSKERVYTIDAEWTKPEFRRNPDPICLVWNVSPEGHQ